MVNKNQSCLKALAGAQDHGFGGAGARVVGVFGNAAVNFRLAWTDGVGGCRVLTAALSVLGVRDMIGSGARHFPEDTLTKR